MLKRLAEVGACRRSWDLGAMEEDDGKMLHLDASHSKRSGRCHAHEAESTAVGTLRRCDPIWHGHYHDAREYTRCRYLLFSIHIYPSSPSTVAPDRSGSSEIQVIATSTRIQSPYIHSLPPSNRLPAMAFFDHRVGLPFAVHGQLLTHVSWAAIKWSSP